MFQVKRMIRPAVLMLAATTVVANLPAKLHAQNPATGISVDVNANRHAISPYIYGAALGTAAQDLDLNLPLDRAGGNPLSTYNWQLNSWSLGSDWFFESVAADNTTTPGEAADTLIANDRAAGAKTMITIPMLGYVATLGSGGAKLSSFSVAKYGPQTGSDGDSGNGISTASGNPYITGNNPLDAYIPSNTATQQAWVNHLLSTWGTASANGVKYYLMDNESSIWQNTHRDAHPIGAHASEIYNDITSYAAMVKAADPAALIVGPEEWGWTGYQYSGYDQWWAGTHGWTNLPDRTANGNMDYMPWLLQSLKSYDTAHGTKSLNVFTLHYYPQQGEYSTDDTANTQAIRNRSTRSLWDPNYTDTSWVGAIVQLIPRMKGWVASYYPNLQTGITEYNWGDDANLNGATTQADIFGIFGRESLDVGVRWGVPPTNSPTYLAMKMFRNYDGAKSLFGNTSCYAGVTNADTLSAFAAQRSTDNALTVIVINKQTGSTPVSVSLANFATTGTAHAYQISSAAQTSITQLADVAVASNTISTTVPSQSVTLFVVPAGLITSVPSAPTGLSATVGSGSVTLNWTAGGGATSYTVKRSTVSGSGYANAGTVTSPAPTSLTNTGLTNGTTYYYVVTGTNSAGTSPNSAELAAMPIVPPTFTATATASPNPVQQGAATTVSANVTCATNSLTNGVIQLLVVNSSGATVASQQWTAQSFTTNQTKPYSLSFTPATFGTFTIAVGVFSSAYQLWSWINSAGTITVNSNTVFTATATSTPSTVAPGAPVAVVGTFTETGPVGLTNGICTVMVVDSANNQIARTDFTGQTFAPNQQKQLQINFNAPAAAGVYTVVCAVFDGGWTTNYLWAANLAPITVTGGGSPPPAPTGLSATAGNAQVALSWTASSGATSYTVKRSTINGSGYANVATPTATNYTNTGLTNGTAYYFVVSATNANGTSGNSNQASATPASGVPPAPTGLTATPGNAQVVLSWTASSGATSYNILRSTINGSGYASVATGIAVTNYTNTGLTNGTAYYFVVTATNSSGTSGNSNQASAMPTAGGSETVLNRTGWTVTASASAAGYPPSNTIDGNTSTLWQNGAAQVGGEWFQINMGSQQTFNQLILDGGAWAGDYPRGYSISVSNDGVNWGNPVATGNPTGANPITITFAAQTARYIKITQTGNGGGHYWTEVEINVYTGGSGPPPAPTGLTATPGNAQVALNWTASSGATSYNLQRSTVSGSGYASVVSQAGTSYTNTGLTNGTTYYFVVSATNASGTSANSAQASATPVAPPAAPTGLTATPGNAQIALSWTASSGATSYNLQRSTVSGSGYASVISQAGTSYTNTGLTNGTTYYYVVNATNASGTSANSAQASGTPTSGGGETVLSRTGWIVTASASGSGSPPSNAIDGNASTIWTNGAAAVGGEWFQINMGSQQTFNQLILDGGAWAGDYPRGYSISVSNDGVNWGSPVATGNPTGANPITITFAAQTARYIKITQTGNGGGHYWTEVEINAYH